RRDERDLVGLNGGRADQDHDERSYLHPFHIARLSYTPARKDAPPNGISQTPGVRAASQPRYDACTRIAVHRSGKGRGSHAHGCSLPGYAACRVRRRLPRQSTKIEKDLAGRYAPPRPVTGVVSVEPFLAKIIARSCAGSVLLGLPDSSCVAPGGSKNISPVL